MIAGDYLYTNYLCRMLMLLQGKAYSDYNPTFKYLKVELGKETFFFRYDDGGKGFVVQNQYGENDVDETIRSMIAAFIYKGMKDSGIKTDKIVINGEEVDIDSRTLYLLAFLGRSYRESHRPYVRRKKCKFSCPFTSVCAWDHTLHIRNDDVRIFRRDNDQELVIGHPFLITYGNLYDAALEIIDLYLNPAKDQLIINEFTAVQEKLVRELGYSRADMLLTLAKKVLKFERLPELDLDTSSYKGYLVKKGKLVIPSDKFWKMVYGEEMEDAIAMLYEKYGGRSREVIWWE